MMYNPVALKLLATDVASRIAKREYFLLALEPEAATARFYPPILKAWRGMNYRRQNTGSTPKETYLKGVKDVISELRQAGSGKVVISRIIVEPAPVVDANWVESMLERHFAKHQNSLRYVAYTEHGLWIGATPERLICIDKAADRYEAMALAGTRSASLTGLPWDDKNVYENDLVARYITERMEAIGLDAVVHNAETLQYGNIEHRLRRVTGSCSRLNPETIVDAINPTPALGGYPMTKALEIISEHESHDRDLYGGTITLDDSQRHDVYVNLRCCRISDGVITYFGGGGITADSDPESEWQETERKISEIRKVICGS